MKFNPIRSILARTLLKPGEPINVLTCPTHAGYEANLANALPYVNFFAYRHEGSQIIDDWRGGRAQPSNYYLLDKKGGDDAIPDVDFHLILSQNPSAHLPHLKRFAQLMNAPLLQLVHTMSYSNDDAQKSRYDEMIGASRYVFITDYSREDWGFKNNAKATTIYHMVDAEEFKPLNLPRGNHVMSLGNEATSRAFELGFQLEQQLVQGLPYKHFGTDKVPQFHHPLNSPAEINREFNNAAVYLNCCKYSPLAMSLIEAATAGTPIVSVTDCAPGQIFTHGENALLFDSSEPERGRQHLEYLLGNPAEAARLGANAREFATKFFNRDRFRSQWEDVIWKTIKSV